MLNYSDLVVIVGLNVLEVVFYAIKVMFNVMRF